MSAMWSARSGSVTRLVERVGPFALASLLAAVLVVVAAQGMLFAYVAIGLAAFAAVLAVLGTERTGMLMLIGAFFTAPMYKGLAPVGSPITPTDLLFVAGFGLLFPQLLVRRMQLPLMYYAGVTIVFLTGLVASAASQKPGESFMSLGFWMIVMVGLPVAIGLWGPSARMVDVLALTFIGGQMFSLAYGVARGEQAGGRYAGLSTHPNYLAQAGLLAMALLLYLFHRHLRDIKWLLVLIPSAVVVAASIWLSGSRAATVVAAVLILMIPIVERSAVMGFLLAAFVVLTILLLPLIVDMAGEGSSIARLAGDKQSEYSNQARSLGLQEGIDRFFAHPLRGDGIVDLYYIHNNFLEVALSIGVFGLAGYLMVLFVFARPLFGDSEFRRLGYPVWAYIGFGATVPSLYDRSIWAVVALSVVALTVPGSRRSRADDDVGLDASLDEAATPSERAPARQPALATNPGDHR
jgi:hypothetical protein